MSTLNPTSFRYPFELKNLEKSDPEATQAHRYAFQGLTDLNNAIVALKKQGGTTPTAGTTTVITENAAGGTPGPPGPPGAPGSGAPPGLGGINNQTGNASYVTQSTDNGILLIFSNAAGTAVTLNSGVTIPYFFFTSNLGSTGTATLTPSSGLINGGANFPLLPLHTGWVAFDGANWTITALPTSTLLLETNSVNNASQNILNLVNGTNITITDLGAGSVQIAASTSTVSAYVPRAKTANYTAVANDVVFCDTSGGGFTITIPASASNSGAAILVKKVSSDANNLTLARTGADLIDGATSQVTPLPFSSYFLVADGVTAWEIF